MPRSTIKIVAIRRAVLALALAEHPKLLTIPSLAREMAEDGDAVERAVRDLVGVGLLECGGISVKSTPAALHFDHLGL